jgi:hypothetical protein
VDARFGIEEEAANELSRWGGGQYWDKKTKMTKHAYVGILHV